MFHIFYSLSEMMCCLTLEGCIFLICCLFSTAANFKTSSSPDVSRKEKELKIDVEREISIEGHDSSSASTSKKKGPLLKIEGKPQIISGDMMKMSMSSKSGSAKNANRARALASAPFKPEKWMLPDQIEDKLSQLNLAIVSYPFVFLLRLIDISPCAFPAVCCRF